MCFPIDVDPRTDLYELSGLMSYSSPPVPLEDCGVGRPGLTATLTTSVEAWPTNFIALMQASWNSVMQPTTTQRAL